MGKTHTDERDWIAVFRATVSLFLCRMLRSLRCDSALALSVILILHTVPFSSLPTTTPRTAPPSPLSSPTPSPSSSVPPVGSSGGHGVGSSSSNSTGGTSAPLSSGNQKQPDHQGSLADGGEATGGRTGTSHPASSSSVASSSVPSTPASVTSSTTATTTTTSPLFAHNVSSSSSSTVVITPYYPYPRLSAFPPAIPASICLNFLGDLGQYMMMTDGGGNVSTTPSPGTGVGSASQNRQASSSSASSSQQQMSSTFPHGARGAQGGVIVTAAGTTSPASSVIPSLRDVMHAAALGCGCGISLSSSTTIDQHTRPSFFSSEDYLGGGQGVLRAGREDSLEWTTGALCSSAMSEDIRRFRTVGDRVFALELLGFLMADQGVHIAEEDRLYQLACLRHASRHRHSSTTSRTTTTHLKNRNEEREGGETIDGDNDDRYRKVGGAVNETNSEEEEEETDTFSPLKVVAERSSSPHGQQEKYQNEAGFHNEERTLLYPRNRGVWLLCATHLNILLRRYVIGAAAETVKPPLDCILLRYKKQELRKRYLRLHHHASLRDRQMQKEIQSKEKGVAVGGSPMEEDGRTTAYSSSSIATGGRVPDKDQGGARNGRQGERTRNKRGLADREMEERIGHMLYLWGKKFNVETPACKKKYLFKKVVAFLCFYRHRGRRSSIQYLYISLYV